MGEFTMTTSGRRILSTSVRDVRSRGGGVGAKGAEHQRYEPQDAQSHRQYLMWRPSREERVHSDDVGVRFACV